MIGETAMAGKIVDRRDKERQVNPRSLENLKLGAEARNQDKQRTNLTLLPETVQWLKGTGNASEKVDELVTEARRNNSVSAPGASEQVEQLQKALEQEREKVRQLEQAVRAETERANDAVLDGLKAATILQEALKFKSNNATPIKARIREALKLIDDI
jgi:hypothetical protein